MAKIWQTIRGYIWWTYKRGSLHYDVMVTLILLFIFLAPHWINFNDKPTERIAHQTGVIVYPEGDGFVYQIDADVVQGRDADSMRRQFARIIEPIAGEIEVQQYQPVRDSGGHTKFYKVWVTRPYR